MQLGRVFISSVFGGLLDLRETAAEAARLAGLEPVSTEHHIAQPDSVRAALARAIEACDTYVGLFDVRRGTVPDSGTRDHRAITEEEFRIARERNLRCLVFLSRAPDSAREPGLADFIAAEVTSFDAGLWTRPYDGPEALRREIVAALSALRPRVVLALARTDLGLEATLHLGGVRPAWMGEEQIGPTAVDLSLSPPTVAAFAAFRAGTEARSHLSEATVRVAGSELAGAAYPGSLGRSLEAILDLAAAAGRLLTLEIRTVDPLALAFPWELLNFHGHPLPVREGLLEIVRRIDPADPSRDPAPSVPPRHLAVLGFTAAPDEDQAIVARLGAGGLSDADLFWEREQERLLVAFEGLLREARGQLVLPDSGEKDDLRQQFARLTRPQLVHISCHGGVINGASGKPEPVLLLEDPDGRRAPLTAPELLRWTRATPGAADLELLVLSACSTVGAPPLGSAAHGLGAAAAAESTAGGRAPGLAEALVAGGLARVLGMQSTISDEGATAFAEGFYQCLARGTDLPGALRAGRAELATRGQEHEWAVPTLLTRRDTGPLASPQGSAAPGETALEVTRHDFDIAGVTYLERGYVGRRDAERRLRRAFAAGEPMLVIHGLGGIGKSTLAARFLERRRAEGARVVVLYAGRRLTPEILLGEVAAKVEVTRSAGLPPDQAEAAFRSALSSALAEVAPTVLLLDNFEDNQDADGRFLDPGLGEVLVDLAQMGGASFRLLLTSRLPITLPGALEAWNLDLGELSRSGCRKLRLLDREGLGSLDEKAWDRVLYHLGGHPKALELLGGYLRSRPDRARNLLANFGDALSSLDDKLAAERQHRGRSLLVETVLAQVPPERLPAFDRLCLLGQPFPTDELDGLLVADGVAHAAADLAWLRDHGLLARSAGPAAVTGGDAVHRLLASRRPAALAEREGEEIARAWHRRVADHLESRSGPLADLGAAARHRDASGDRAGALDLSNRWAIQLRLQHAYRACREVALEGLASFPPGGGEAERVAAADLWMKVYDGAVPLGAVGEGVRALAAALVLLDGAESAAARFSQGSVLLRRGRAWLNAGRLKDAADDFEQAAVAFTAGGHTRDRAIALGDIGHLRAQTGDVQGALELYNENLSIYEKLGAVRERAITLSHIARLHAREGKVQDALELHQEALKTYEQLRDVGAWSIALGDIAHLRSEAGDTDGAYGMLIEKLEVNRGLADADGIASSQFDLAKLELEKGKRESASTRLAESWQILSSIGRADAITAVGILYGRLLADSDRPQAITVLHRTREACSLLDLKSEAAEIDALLETLDASPALKKPSLISRLLSTRLLKRIKIDRRKRS